MKRQEVIVLGDYVYKLKQVYKFCDVMSHLGAVGKMAIQKLCKKDDRIFGYCHGKEYINNATYCAIEKIRKSI